MKIWYQSAAPIQGLTHYKAALEKHASQALEGAQVRFNGVREERYHGRLPAEMHRYPYAKFLLQTDSIEFALQAESEGFDAFIVGSFSEPFLAETRSVLGIPVVSLAEAAMLTACMLCEQFALVTLSPSYAHRVRAVVKRHGLESRLSGVYALSSAQDEASVDAAFASPAALVADFTEVATRAADGGADVVIPAEGLLSELMHANGVKTVGGASVLDCVGAALLQAELLVRLHRRLGVGVGRRWSYTRPPADLLALLRSEKKT